MKKFFKFNDLKSIEEGNGFSYKDKNYIFNTCILYTDDKLNAITELMKSELSNEGETLVITEDRMLLNEKINNCTIVELLEELTIPDKFARVIVDKQNQYLTMKRGIMWYLNDNIPDPLMLNNIKKVNELNDEEVKFPVNLVDTLSFDF